MKKTLILAAFLFLACSEKSEKSEAVQEVKFSSPPEVVMSFVKALNAQDSSAIENVLSKKSKQSILPKIREVGGFKTMFDAMKGMQMDVTIIGVDSASNPAKIFTNQKIVKDTTIFMKLDSLHFSAIREDGGWKLISLNARPNSMNP